MTAATVPAAGAPRAAIAAPPADPAEALAPGQAAAFALLLAAGLQPGAAPAPAGLPSPAAPAAGEEKDKAAPDAAPASAPAPAPADPAIALALAAFQPAASGSPAPGRPLASAPTAPRPAPRIEAPETPRAEAKPEAPAAARAPAPAAAPAPDAAPAPAKALAAAPGTEAPPAVAPHTDAPEAPERAGAELALGALHRAIAPAPAPVYEVRAPLRAPDWEGEVARGIQWMASERLQSASLQLNPPDLGPVQVVLHLSGDGGSQASVSFASPHADVRAALEASLPRLREMLGQAGIQLGQASVGADAFPQPGGNAGSAPAFLPAAAVTAAASPAPARAGQGLIDTFV